MTAAKRFCHTCHELKTRGWRVSLPDADGQCTFTPPDDRSFADQLADNLERAIANRHRGPPPD